MEEDASYVQIPTNRPRHLVTVNEVIGRLGRVAKIIQIVLNTPELEAPSVQITLRDINKLVDDGTAYKVYKGGGPTVGHSLREILDQVNEDFPLGGEYDELTPPLPPAA